MVYGLIFLGYTKLTAQDQRIGISRFAKTHHIQINEFVSFNNDPDILIFNPGDKIIFYSWDCLCKDMSFLRAFIQYMVKNGICIYSVTSKYHIDSSMDIKTLQYAFLLYKDIRFNFLSRKAVTGAGKRMFSGRYTGSKNKTYILDGKEKVVCDMYNSGFSMYAISKKLKVSAPTIKRFLTI